MSARPDAMLNRIADGLVRLLELDIAASPHLWAQRPATLRRGVTQEVVGNATRPMVLVTSNGTVVQVEQRPAGYQRARATLNVILISEDAEAPERGIVDLLTDVCRALANNRQFTGVDLGDDPFLRSGRIVVGDAQIDVDSDEGSGAASLEVHVDYQWSVDAP